jgi:hypothetical protein
MDVKHKAGLHVIGDDIFYLFMPVAFFFVMMTIYKLCTAVKHLEDRIKQLEDCIKALKIMSSDQMGN